MLFGTLLIPQEKAGGVESRPETTDKQAKSEFNPVAGINTDKSGNSPFLMSVLIFILFSNHSVTEL